MPARPEPFRPVDSGLMSQLACPACLGALRAEQDRLICVGCDRAYPIVDGIPVLIVERAEARSSAALAHLNRSISADM